MTVLIIIGAVCSVVFTFYMRSKHPTWGVWRLLLCYFGAWTVIVGLILLIGFFRGPVEYYSVDDYVERSPSAKEVLGVAEGEDSFFLVVREKDRLTYDMLIKTENGFNAVSCRQTYLKRNGILHPRMFYNIKTSDHYLILWSVGIGSEFVDSENSQFVVLPVGSEPQDQSCLVVAYIGHKSTEYYKTDYWIQVISTSGGN